MPLRTLVANLADEERRVAESWKGSPAARSLRDQDPAEVVAGAATLDGALKAALAALCADQRDLLAHAVRAVEPRSPLRPLGILCGHDAEAHAVLGSALTRLRPPGTGLTRAAVRERRPVWVPSVASSPSFLRRDLLVRHGIRSAAAFPVAIGSKMAAVIELLSFDRIDREATEAAASALTAELQEATQRHWQSLSPKSEAPGD